MFASLLGDITGGWQNEKRCVVGRTARGNRRAGCGSGSPAKSNRRVEKRARNRDTGRGDSATGATARASAGTDPSRSHATTTCRRAGTVHRRINERSLLGFGEHDEKPGDEGNDALATEDDA